MSSTPFFDTRSYVTKLGCLLVTFVTVVQYISAEPQPGDVFREYHLTEGGSNGEPDAEWKDEFVYISHHSGERSTVGSRQITGIDLEHAIRAEFVACYWGGHIGSENRSVIFNDHAPVALPLIQNTPTCPECYFSQQCQAACEIPLDFLQQGTNEFRLEVGDQICYSFDWGWFWTNQVVLRVYYDPEKKEHPQGSIESPQSGETVTNFSKISCKIEHGEVESVEFIGKYNDFSWGGSGEFNSWHGIFWQKDPQLQRHIGTASGLFPYVSWDCRWIPDQENIKIAARLIDKSGIITMTEAVNDLKLKHRDRTVRMFTSQDVPENFATQTGSKSCTIEITDDLNDAYIAKLVFSTFSGGTEDREILINGKSISKGGWGRWHRLDFCEEFLPVSILKPGKNTFTIKANYPGEHAFEVNWPGPIILVEYLDNP